MTPDKLRQLRDYYDNHSTADEMEGGHWETDVNDDPNVSITVSLRKSVLDKLRERARVRGISTTEMAAAALDSYLSVLFIPPGVLDEESADRFAARIREIRDERDDD